MVAQSQPVLLMGITKDTNLWELVGNTHGAAPLNLGRTEAARFIIRCSAPSFAADLM
ncbi:MAG TPA: hypothetical protein PK239_13210 [Chitinophagales bacterium]|nr:hypothetical protein [Chitinophagales bacterium]HRK28229.1 hypothetical protein [Chitinophagales bacterium]